MGDHENYVEEKDVGDHQGVDKGKKDQHKNNRKIKIAFFDQGIDTGVQDFQGIEFHQIKEIPALALLHQNCFHGTAVFGAFYRVLDDLVKEHKNVAIKDIVTIIDHSIFYTHIHDRAIFDAHYHVCRSYSKIFDTRPDALNMSIISSIADYNVISSMSNNGEVLKKNRRKGTLTFVAAGNWGQIISTNDLFPQNNLDVLTVGGLYPKDFKRPEGWDIGFRLGYTGTLSTPGTGVIFSTLGRHITYNTQSPSFIKTFDKDLKTTYRIMGGSNIPKYVDLSGTSLAAPALIAYKTYAKWRRPDLDSYNIEQLLIASVEEVDGDKYENGWSTPELSRFFRTAKYNHARNSWNGMGYPVSYEWGLGRIDKERFLHLVDNWQPQKIEEETITISYSSAYREGDYYCYSYDYKADHQIYVLTLDVRDKNIPRKEVNYLSLTSPSKTESYFHHPLFSWETFDDSILFIYGDLYTNTLYLKDPINNRLKNTHFCGEDGKGKWILKSNVPLQDATITFRSLRNTADDIYRYDDRILTRVDNPPLSDLDGGENVIDLSYCKKCTTEVNFLEKKIYFKVGDKVKATVPIASGQFQKVIPSQLGCVVIGG